MANDSPDRQLRKLQAENKRLLAEIESLQSQLAMQQAAFHSEPPGVSATRLQLSSSQHAKNILRRAGIVVCMVLAVALLILGNILFWAGGTIVDSDRYVASTAPLIKDVQIQNALAAKTTQALFNSVNVDQVVTEALPPRAEFLAPTLSSQVKQSADDAVKKILQRPQFQERWNTAQQRAHDRFIAAVGKNGSDGSIDISEVYTSASQQLKGTSLAFLADKPLPAKVGNIQLVSGKWISTLETVIRDINTWRVIAIILLVVFSALAGWLSRNRRRTVMTLAWLFAGSMFLTVVAGRLVRERLADRADPQYAEAVRHAYTIIAHPLAVQTWTILAVSLLVGLVAWVSGPYPSSRAVRAKINQLLSGKLHAVLFSKENRLTLWVGEHKALLQWLVVAAVTVSWLFVRLTPAVLAIQVIIIILLVFAVEILAAKPTEPAKVGQQ